MKNWTIDRSINKCQSVIDGMIQQHTYRAARYLNDITIDLNYCTEWNEGLWNYRLFNTQDADLAQSPKINVIKSAIDTLVSKLANQKVRPYFNPVNGLFSTRKIVKQAQQYFDIYYDKQHIQNKVAMAYRNACIFGIGYLFFNPFLLDVEVPGTWQVGVCSTEKSYGSPTKLLIEYRNYPTTLLNRYSLDSNSEYVNFKLFFDTIEHKAIFIINDRKVKTENYKPDVIPIIPVYNTVPIYGTRTVSIVDELDGIQTNIDLYNQKISAAAQLTAANTTYVSAGSNLDASQVSNRTGMVYTVKMGPGATQLPVINVAPAPCDPTWTALLDKYIQQAYEIVGISQLSAQSQKPSGLNSGVALQTLSDIESDRFMVQLQGYTNAFVDLANLIIEVNDNKSILPKSIATAEYSWEDVRKQKDLFKVQFSAMSILSKDPQTKLQQIMQLSQIGLITTANLATYLDSPDLEGVYSGASAIKDAIDKVIENAIEKGEYDIPDYIGYQSLLTELITIENQLFSAGDTKSLERISKLKEKLLDTMNENGFVDLSNTPETIEGENMSAVGSSAQQLAEQEALAEANPLEEDTTPAESDLANPNQASNLEIPE